MLASSKHTFPWFPCSAPCSADADGALPKPPHRREGALSPWEGAARRCLELLPKSAGSDPPQSPNPGLALPADKNPYSYFILYLSCIPRKAAAIFITSLRLHFQAPSWRFGSDIRPEIPAKEREHTWAMKQEVGVSRTSQHQFASQTWLALD